MFCFKHRQEVLFNLEAYLSGASDLLIQSRFAQSPMVTNCLFSSEELCLIVNVLMARMKSLSCLEYKCTNSQNTGIIKICRT